MNMHHIKVLNVFVQPARKFRRVAEPLAESHRKEDGLRSLILDRRAFLNPQPAWSICIRGGDEHLDSTRMESAGQFEDGATRSTVTWRNCRDDM